MKQNKYILTEYECSVPFIIHLLSYKKQEAYSIIMPKQLLNQMTEFHQTLINCS